jgi:hypothetical protein
MKPVKKPQAAPRTVKQHGMPPVLMTPRPRLSGRNVVFTSMVFKTQ